MEMFKHRGKNFFLVRNKKRDSSHVEAFVQEARLDKRIGEYKSVGRQVSNYGGFKYAKDFDYDVALRAACENASDILMKS